MDDQAPAVIISRATAHDVDDVTDLLRANEAPRGSLMGHFAREWVAAAIAAMPVIIARIDTKLAGALLSSPIDDTHAHPVISGMLAVYRGGPDAYIYGPICVAEVARGRGVVRSLFERLRAELPGREGILFIRKDNASSLRAHEKLTGMQVRGEFRLPAATFVVLSFPG